MYGHVQSFPCVYIYLHICAYVQTSGTQTLIHTLFIYRGSGYVRLRPEYVRLCDPHTYFIYLSRVWVRETKA